MRQVKNSRPVLSKTEEEIANLNQRIGMIGQEVGELKEGLRSERQESLRLYDLTSTELNKLQQIEWDRQAKKLSLEDYLMIAGYICLAIMCVVMVISKLKKSPE